MSTLFNDIKYAVRMVVKKPGFTSVVVMTLAIGIGANTTIFSCLNALLLRPLPYQDQERLVFVQERSERLGRMAVSYPNFRDWREKNQTMEDLACFRNTECNVSGGEMPERLHALHVSSGFFKALGVQPEIGRLYSEDDDRPGASKTVVLSHSLWQQRYGMQENMLGESILIDRQPHAVIGVLPESFAFPPFLSSQPQLWLPFGLQADPDWFLKRGDHVMACIGKLKEGVTLDQAKVDMEHIALQLEQQYPDSNTGSRVALSMLRDRMTQNIRPLFLILMASVALVLLIASANVANLFLVHATERVQEFAIRTALGARRMKINSQLLCESALLVILGGAIGTLFAVGGLKLLARRLSAEGIPIPNSFFAMDQTSLLFILIITLGTGLLFGLFPAIQSSRVGLSAVMKESSRSATGGLGRSRFRKVLTISEIAMALVLLTGAGLLVRSFLHYLHADPGYNPNHVLTLRLSLPERQYPEAHQMDAFHTDLIRRLQTIPGIRHAGLATNLLGGWQSTYAVEGAPMQREGESPWAEFCKASPDYFAAMGIQLVQGRYFTRQDNHNAKPVVIVDETFSQKWWPNESPLGKRLRRSTEPPGDDNPWHDVVGVVGHVKHYGVDKPSREALYFPLFQWSDASVTLIVRTQGDPLASLPPIRREMAALDSELPVSNVRTLHQYAAEQSFARRFLLSLLGIFALTALFLAALGIYGVIAHSVTQRTHEIGVRMALGATMQTIMQMIVGQGFRLVLYGLIFGFIASVWVAYLLSSQLYNVSIYDPTTYLVVAGILLAVALLACFSPAWRASRLSPMKALRYE